MHFSKYFFISSGIILSFLVVGYISATPISSTEFPILLSNMDPVTHTSGTPIPGGKGAIVMLLQNFSEILLFMIPIMAGISVIVAGYYYIFSSGDTEKATQGKTIIKWNIVAMFVAFFSWTLIKLIASLFS